MISALLYKTKKVMGWMKNHGVDAKKAAALLFAFLACRKLMLRKKIPLGPMAFPVVGNLHLLKLRTEPGHEGEMPNLGELFMRLSKQYGDPFSFWFGNQLAVVINTPTLQHEALKLKNSQFSERLPPPSQLFFSFGGKGTFLNPCWKTAKRNRKIIIDHFSGQQHAEKQSLKIADEVHSTIHLYRKRMEKVNSDTLIVADFRNQIIREGLNTTLLLLYNFRYSTVISSEFKDFLSAASGFAEILSAGNPSDYIPLLRLLPQSSRDKELRKLFKVRNQYLFKWFDEGRRTWIKGQPRNLQDEFFDVQEKEGMTKEEIFILLGELVVASVDTTNFTFEWGIYIIAMHPDVQKKIHEELDIVIGPTRLPTYEDQLKLPYLSAVLLEIFRFRFIVPVSIPKANKEDAQLGGYFIPKDTLVISNNYSLFNSEDVWKEPKKFRPERFLEEEKSLAGAIFQAELKTDANSMKLSPFGHGRRFCPGYRIAKISIFLKFVTYLHCFSISPIPGEKFDLNAEHMNIVSSPNEYKVQLTARPGAFLAESIEGKYTEH